MVLESTMVCVDNSEWMRNGDFLPTRFQAQADAINFLAGAKTQQHPENTVGVLSLAGKVPRVLVTPTQDLGKVLGAMHGLTMEGEVNFSNGVQVAQLALKHRQNKNQRQRIVLFAGSPIEAEQDALIKIGKKLKKNNVAVDIVSFGDQDEGKQEKLEAFHGAVNSSDNSHLVIVPQGAVLADFLLSSPVFTGEEGSSEFAASAAAGAAGAAGGSAAVGGDFEFGVDPNVDPELALALRVSMEEERARQEAKSKETGEASGSGEASASAEATATPAATQGVPTDMDMEEDDYLQQALAMSLNQTPAATVQGAPPAVDEPAPMEEDAELALAIQMSMADAAGAGAAAAPPAAPSGEDRSQVLDASFLNSVLAQLPGVDPQDAALQEMVAQVGQGGTSGEEKKEEEEKKEGEE
mmetsp:Transcript_37991/g.45834  ORF Transcript_37991/g.45834 Transcript_37991/m.45834 type:complete len:410 (+) Transcript_37991:99-1328(+)|eukprot:CAMPEP_0197847320 /NCGR_PEP_ID=MMETSP1438-20131217/5709_1 /TAXON_ID=1461541 /ORGANISM="Pterosperma sp., Strain CCMP1384" /LENGTH=409 /DNA_ID=CAMNT_0043459203 /DNA_START=99 /DNA_END=1328 /DNA_ORIENTATION=+